MRLAVPAALGIAELRQRVTIPPFPLFKCRHEYYDCLAHSRHCRLARANRPRLLANQPFYLGVGRSNGRFTPKVLIILALDSEQRVRDSILMQGLTIFAAPQKLTQLHGMKFSDIDPAAVFPQRPRYQQALASALTRKD